MLSELASLPPAPHRFSFPAKPPGRGTGGAIALTPQLIVLRPAQGDTEYPMAKPRRAVSIDGRANFVIEKRIQKLFGCIGISGQRSGSRRNITVGVKIGP